MPKGIKTRYFVISKVTGGEVFAGLEMAGGEVNERYRLQCFIIIGITLTGLLTGV